MMLIGAKAGEANNEHPNAPEPPEVYIIEATTIAIWTTVLIRTTASFASIMLSKSACNELLMEQKIIYRQNLTSAPVASVTFFTSVVLNSDNEGIFPFLNM